MRYAPFAIVALLSCERMVEPSAPILSAVSPPQWCAGNAPTELDIEGVGLFARARVDLGAGPTAVNDEFHATLGEQPIVPLRWLSNVVLRGQPPQDLPEGVHDVVVVTPDGVRATLERAVTVFEASHPGCIAVNDWWQPEFHRRIRIGLDNRGRTVLNNFPVLVQLTPAVIDYAELQGGAGLRFVDDDDSTVLPHEIESWSDGGTSNIWVGVTRVAAGVDTDHIWLYYDNPGAGSAEDAAGVWSNGHRAVWHLNGQAQDSSASGKHGTPVNIEPGDWTDGMVAGGLELDGVDEVVRIDGSSAPGDALDIVGGPLTISAWVFLDNTRGTIAGKRDSGAQWQFYTGEDTAGLFKLYHRWADSGGERWETTSEFPISAWYHIAVSSNAAGEVQNFWVNGQRQQKTLGDGSGTAPVHVDVDVCLGARWDSDPDTAWLLDGVLDEVRISAAVRSDSWVEAVFDNTSGGMVTFGASEARP